MSTVAANLLRGSSLRVIQTVISIIIGFWMLPFLFQNLGSEQYGVWVLLGSTVGAFYIIDLGFSHAITRYVAEYIYSERYDAANRIINTALAIYSALGLIILLIAIVISAFIFDSQEITSIVKSDNAAEIAFLILAFSLAIEFPAKAFPGIINAFLRYDRIAQIRTVFVLLRALLIYVFVSNDYEIVAIAVITLITNLLSTIIYVFYSKHLLSTLKFSKTLVNKEDLLLVFHFSKWVFLIDTAFLLKDKLGIWFIAGFGMTPILPVYYAAQRLSEYAAQFTNQALAMSSPLLTKYHTENNHEKLVLTHSLFFKLYIICSAIFFCGFIVCGEKFLQLWMGDNFDYSTSASLLLILAAGFTLIMLSQPYISILMALKRHKPAAIVSTLEVLTAVGSSFYIGDKYGLIGIAITCSLSMGIIRIIAIPLIAARFISTDLLHPLPRALTYSAATATTALILESYIPANTSLSMMISVAVIIPFFCVLAAPLLFNQKEKVFLIEKINSLLIRAKKS